MAACTTSSAATMALLAARASRLPEKTSSAPALGEWLRCYVMPAYPAGCWLLEHTAFHRPRFRGLSLLTGSLAGSTHAALCGRPAQTNKA